MEDDALEEAAALGSSEYWSSETMLPLLRVMRAVTAATSPGWSGPCTIRQAWSRGVSECGFIVGEPTGALRTRSPSACLRATPRRRGPTAAAARRRSAPLHRREPGATVVTAAPATSNDCRCRRRIDGRERGAQLRCAASRAVPRRSGAARSSACHEPPSRARRASAPSRRPRAGSRRCGRAPARAAHPESRRRATRSTRFPRPPGRCCRSPAGRALPTPRAGRR